MNHRSHLITEWACHLDASGGRGGQPLAGPGLRVLHSLAGRQDASPATLDITLPAVVNGNAWFIFSRGGERISARLGADEVAGLWSALTADWRGDGGQAGNPGRAWRFTDAGRGEAVLGQATLAYPSSRLNVTRARKATPATGGGGRGGAHRGRRQSLHSSLFLSPEQEVSLALLLPLLYERLVLFR